MPPARRASNYIEAAELAQLVRDYRRTKVLSDALARCMLAIAGGVWDRYRFTSSRDDFVQDVVVHLMQRPLAKASVQKHIFNYFTTCAIRFGMKLRDREIGDRRRFATYAAELVEAGRELPSANEHIDQGDILDRNGGETLRAYRPGGRHWRARYGRGNAKG